MFSYYVRLAFKSFQRTPGLTLLMVLAIALGVGVCVMMVTVYHTMSGNPIWWKNDRLYYVQMDSWDADQPADEQRPDLPPLQLTYRDARAVFESDIPVRKVMMRGAYGVITGGTAESKPVPTDVRVTTADFFAMFDVPFLYGGGWRAEADDLAEPVMVISREHNEKLFGGINSVGRTIRWNDREFRIIGVLDYWHPKPRFYDITTQTFVPPEDAFVPFGLGAAMELPVNGNTSCWKSEPIESYEQFEASECVWLQMWVELADAGAVQRMQNYIDNYWAEQRKDGRFQRPKNNRLSTVSQLLEEREVVGDDSRVLLGLAFAFLAVCLINTVGLLLAKFLNAAPITGVRRALGASRKQVFAQHLVEVGTLACVGSLLGLALGAVGLAGLRALYTLPGQKDAAAAGIASLAHFDTASIVTAVTLAIVSALAAGLYPAWRIGRLPPAVYLKSQ